MMQTFIRSLLLLFACHSVVIAQAPRVSENSSSENNTGVIEEVTVIGMRDILSLQKQVYLAEDRFYELFNKLNTDDLYDVRCRWQAPIGTRIKRRQCFPNFYQKATADYADAFLEGRFMVPVTSTLSVHYPELEARMKELVLANPELFERISELFELSERLENNKRVYFGKDDLP